MPLAWSYRGQVQSPERSAKAVIAQRTSDPSCGGAGRKCRRLSGRTFSIACLAFEEGQRLDVAHQLFEVESIGLSKLPPSVGHAEYRLAESVGVIERSPAAWAAEAKPGKRPIRLPPRLEDGLTRSHVGPEGLPADKSDEREESSSQHDAGEKNPEHGSLVDPTLDWLPR
jgi:hypothetical protein